jgi:hypothetical protein
MFHKKICLYHGTNHKVDEQDKTFYLDHIMSRSLGLDQTKIHRSANFDTSKLVDGVSCAHRCIIIGSIAMLAQNPTGKYD